MNQAMAFGYFSYYRDKAIKDDLARKALNQNKDFKPKKGNKFTPLNMPLKFSDNEILLFENDYRLGVRINGEESDYDYNTDTLRGNVVEVADVNEKSIADGLFVQYAFNKEREIEPLYIAKYDNGLISGISLCQRSVLGVFGDDDVTVEHFKNGQSRHIKKATTCPHRDIETWFDANGNRHGFSTIYTRGRILDRVLYNKDKLVYAKEYSDEWGNEINPHNKYDSSHFSIGTITTHGARLRTSSKKKDFDNVRFQAPGEREDCSSGGFMSLYLAAEHFKNNKEFFETLLQKANKNRIKFLREITERIAKNKLNR